MKQAWACLSLRPPIGFTIKVFQGSNQISASITKKKSSLSSKTPSKCIFPMISILSTSCILHHHKCIASLACFAIMLLMHMPWPLYSASSSHEHIAFSTCFTQSSSIHKPQHAHWTWHRHVHTSNHYHVSYVISHFTSHAPLMCCMTS